ncbi:hypothetical protein LCGC14_1409560 [marine sediment metagenome]|uniref:Uncharacterized protein n=1 Tax=marine sediment metagenome TaxID=412755 RepID=A0A0F9JUQ2_9ZZZZ
MIIPLKHQHYNDHLKSICMHHEEHGSSVVCFCDFEEIEELIQEGWEISDKQKTIYDWIDESSAKENYDESNKKRSI